MKKSTLLFFIPTVSLCTLLAACINTSQANTKNILPVFELTDTKDTINYVDIKGLKQGHWIVYEINSGNSNLNACVTAAADTVKTDKPANWTNTCGKYKIEEGFYKDDKKIAWWKRFEKDGSLKDSLKYQ